MNNKRRPYIIWLGLRGFPDVMGGVENHSENLCPRLVELGCDIQAIVRAQYMSGYKGDSWKGVRFCRIWSPKSRGLEAIVHSILGVMYAAFKRPDILHIQAIGPALVTPLARLLGLKVVVTHHGPDYDRQKWGFVARIILKLGERMGMMFSNGRITISAVIHDIVMNKYNKDSDIIGNAVVLPELSTSEDVIDSFALEKGKYILLVSRLVPEKRHLDLIEAFIKLPPNDWKLVIVGASDHPDEYEQQVLQKINVTEGAVSTGYQMGEALQELYTHAGLFVLPSSHEGHPIALLEAMSYGLPTLISDIPAHTEMQLDESQYFPSGNVEVLLEKMQSVIDGSSAYDRDAIRNFVLQNYLWENVAIETALVYESVMCH